MQRDLSILCVTTGDPHAGPFLTALAHVAGVTGAQLVLAADGAVAIDRVRAWPASAGAAIIPVTSRGYIESVLDVALLACTGAYVLRLDDDERCSPAMIDWLAAAAYRAADHWKFARAHVWTAREFLVTSQLWPDCQTRLSRAALAGGRGVIHAGSPFGGGTLAPVVIEHHKFRVKSVAARRAIADRYDRIQRGAGSGGMRAFNVPEEVYSTLPLADLGRGNLYAIGTISREVAPENTCVSA